MEIKRSKLFTKIALFILIVALLTGCAKSWEKQYNLGIKYLEEGNYQEAIIAFTEAIEIDDKQPLPYVGRGDAYILLDESFEEAQVDYEKALELDDTTVGAYLGMVEICIRQDRITDAIDILKNALEKTGDAEIIKSKLEEMSTPEQMKKISLDAYSKYFREKVKELRKVEKNGVFAPAGAVVDKDKDGIPDFVTFYSTFREENFKICLCVDGKIVEIPEGNRIGTIPDCSLDVFASDDGKEITIARNAVTSFENSNIPTFYTVYALVLKYRVEDDGVKLIDEYTYLYDKDEKIDGKYLKYIDGVADGKVEMNFFRSTDEFVDYLESYGMRL